jgi:hypothetical protein
MQFIRWSKFYGFFKYVISKCVLVQFFNMESECPSLQSLLATTQMHVCTYISYIYVHLCGVNFNKAYALFSVVQLQKLKFNYLCY